MTHKKGIHLYSPPANRLHLPTGLNAYQKIMGSLGLERRLSFAYADADGILLPNMTLEENMLIDGLPISQYRGRQFSLAQYFEQNNNSAMLELFRALSDATQPAQLASPQDRKISILLKTMMREVHYLLLDFPERHLETPLRSLFARALEQQIKKSGQFCIITSDQNVLWQRYVHGHLMQGEDKQWSLRATPKQQLIGTFLPTLDLLKEDSPEADQQPSPPPGQERKAS